MRQRVTAGGHIDAVTTEEMHKMFHNVDPVSRVRAGETIQLDATGSGIVTVFKVPAGAKLAVRRVAMNLSTAGDPYTGNVPFSAGHYVKYLRSGLLIGYAIPLAPTALAQVPGVEDWSEQQGPVLTQSEAFQVQAVGLTANAGFTVDIQGLMYGPEIREPNR